MVAKKQKSPSPKTENIAAKTLEKKGSSKLDKRLAAPLVSIGNKKKPK